MRSRVIVTYAPTRELALASEAWKDHSRLGLTLAGALVAGGLAFSADYFVRSDRAITGGASAEKSGRPLMAIKTGAVPKAPSITSPAARAATRSSPLPYLALVKGPHPPGDRTDWRARSRPATLKRPDAAGVPRAGHRDASSAGIAQGNKAVSASARRRDLQGFLQEQGFVLAPAKQQDVPLAPDLERSADDAPEPLRMPQTVADARTVDLRGAESTGASIRGDPRAPGLLNTETAYNPLDVTHEGLAIPQPPIKPSVSAGAGSGAQAFNSTGAEASRATSLSAPTAGVAPTYMQSYPLAVVNGEVLGAVTLRDSGPQGVWVDLGALVGLLRLRMPEAEFVRLSTAASGQFVSLSQLREGGIEVGLDLHRDRMVIEAR